MKKLNNDNVSKSVRLPMELVSFVEEQEGRDFSKKLVNLLTDIPKAVRAALS